jgi:repressor LexA
VTGRADHLTLDAVYAWVVRYVDEHGYAPTIREISAGLGLRSNSAAHRWVEELERADAIRRGPRGTSRTFVLTRPAPTAVERG